MFVIFSLKFVEMPVKGVPKNAVLLAAKVTIIQELFLAHLKQF